MQARRPVILVDLDNVVYDWAQSMARWLDRNHVLHFPRTTLKTYEPDTKFNHQLSQSEIAMREYKTWEVWEDWGIPKGEFIRWWRLGVEAEQIYAQGPLIAGARNALWRLSDAEWDIHIATSRLTKFGLHDQIVVNTASWLRDNNIPFRNIHFTDDKIAIIADAIVDDRADNMANNETGGFHGEVPDMQFLFPANHNMGRFVTVDEQKGAWDNIVNTLA